MKLSTNTARRLQGLIILGSACLLCSVASASEQDGIVTDLRVSSLVTFNPSHFELSGTRTVRPACAANGYWAIDTDTASGKSFLSTLLTAQATGRPIYVWGTGTCTLRSDMETVGQIKLAP